MECICERKPLQLNLCFALAGQMQVHLNVPSPAAYYIPILNSPPIHLLPGVKRNTQYYKEACECSPFTVIALVPDD